jgi:hypothetical protein
MFFDASRIGAALDPDFLRVFPKSPSSEIAKRRPLNV